MTKDWVWAQARAGRIPHVQLGRYRRFGEEALGRWLEDLELRAAEGQRSARPRSASTATRINRR